jgi:radical SAM family uncharacterized protein/radical SAM-linked protein
MRKIPFEPLLAHVIKPARYINHEINSFQKPLTEETINFCFAYPDVYEVGFSHNGLKILYQLINSEKDSAADRVYAPWPDFGELLKKHNLPLFGVESKLSLADFDVIGFTLQSELTYTNVLYMLDLAMIPLRSEERGNSFPLIIAGGPCASNPENMSLFFDAIFIGEAEEAIIEIKNVLRKFKTKSKIEKLLRLASIDGVYVPELFAKDSVNNKIKIRKYADFHLDKIQDSHQLLPWIQPTHDRFVAEIMRGCGRGCRFCHAGFFYRPVREKSKESIKAKIIAEVARSGWKEVGLSSLSSSDYSCIQALLFELYTELRQANTHISLPSLRVDSLSNEIIELLNKMNQTGLTIAPEAGSQRLRNVINKSLSEEDILNGIKIALENGWQLIKLYFMIGLPTETQKDIEELVRLIEKIIALSRKKLQLNISLSPFVPKPFTPFQWAGMDTKENVLGKIHFIKNALKKYKFVKVKYHDLENQILEGVIGRGDKQIGEWIHQAFRDGAIFDGWSEYFNFEIWRQAADKIGLNLENYTQELDKEKPLPWEHIDSGLKKEFFLKEWEKAISETVTPDCRELCSNCGICEKEINSVYTKKTVLSDQSFSPEQFITTDTEKTFYRVFFAKMGELRFVGHLDLLRSLQRMLRASGLPLHYSAGFHPKPFLSLCPPLAIGIQGENEYFDFALQQNFSLEEVDNKIQSVFPNALTFHTITYSQNKSMRTMEFYPAEEIIVKPDHSIPMAYWQEKTNLFLTESMWLLKRTRSDKEQESDLKQIITYIEWQNGELFLQKKRVGATIYDILASVFDISREQAGAFLITRKRFLQ